MVVTTAQDFLTASERQWIERINREDRAKTEFKTKWGWMIKYYAEQEKALKKLRRCAVETVEAVSSMKDQTEDAKLPQTTSGEVGWLSANPAFALEKVGAFPNTRPAMIPITPPGLLPLRDIEFYLNDY